MVRGYTIFLLALLLAASVPVLFAEDITNNAGWGENVEARVLDAHDRPIPGANVNVTWPLTGVKWATTKNTLTDARGRAYFSIDTYEYMPDKVIYYFYVDASYNGAYKQEKFDHNLSAGSPRTVWLPVYLVTFKTTNQAGQPMSVDVIINNTLKVHTDKDGWGQLPLTKGYHDVSILFGRNEQKSVIYVQEDMDAPLVLKLYSLTLLVMDDRGMPLAAEVGGGSDLLRTDASGEVSFENRTESTLQVTAYYGNLKKEVTLDLNLFNRSLIVFDVHPPTIGEPTSIYNGSMLIVRVPITDTGDYASGFGERRASVVMQYTLPGQNKPKTTQMYTVGYNLFEGAIPIGGNVGDVRYTVIATDADGNTAQSTDVYTIRIDPPNPSQMW